MVKSYKGLFITLVFLNCCFLCFSQDILYVKEGDSIFAKISEISNDKITFKKWNNINGPDYILDKKEVLKVVFQNGVVENFSTNGQNNDLSIEQIKSLLKEKIDQYCYDRSGDNTIIIEYEGNYMRFYLKKVNSDRELHKQNLYDFSKECFFHDLSKRNRGIAFINANIPRLISNTEDNWSNNFKLVIRVNGHENAEQILSLMKEYHNLLAEL